MTSGKNCLLSQNFPRTFTFHFANEILQYIIFCRHNLILYRNSIFTCRNKLTCAAFFFYFSIQVCPITIVFLLMFFFSFFFYFFFYYLLCRDISSNRHNLDQKDCTKTPTIFSFTANRNSKNLYLFFYIS